MTKYEIQNRYMEALAKPGAMDETAIHDEVAAQLEEEYEKAQKKVHDTFRPLFAFNNAQRDETRLLLAAYYNENRAMHDFAVKYVEAASAALTATEEDPDAEK